MKELDELLTRYLANGWGSADDRERTAFSQVLELPDPDLAAYLLGHDTPPAALAAIIARLRAA